MTAPPLPGTVGLSRIGGATGAAIWVGQLLIGDGAPVTHAFVVVSDTEVVQAMPGGAEIAPLADYLDRAGVWFTRSYPLSGSQRAGIVDAARTLVGTPYSFADYLSLAAHRFRIPAPHLRRYIADSGHMICSQLVDECYLRAGVHLFADGRWPGDVTPGDLWRVMVRGGV